jgi:hypothetical protein
MLVYGVLLTQQRLRAAELQLKKAQADVDRLRAEHISRIQRSLHSSNAAERAAAAAIATWWEVEVDIGP